MISTATAIAGFRFDNCIMNAAGVYDNDAAEMDALLESEAASIVSKSATLEPRAGNPEPRYSNTPLGSINSMGLPNHGIDYYLDYLCRLQQTRPGRTFFLSVTGFNIEEDRALLKKTAASGFNGIVELNLSCPNVPGKPQTGYDFDTVAAVLDAVFTQYTAPLGVKLPPYFDLIHFDQICTILNRFPLAYVNSVNSIGNGLCIDLAAEKTLIRPKQGLGGIGGSYLKPTALANVFAMRQRLNDSIRIIGTGGVETGGDVFEHILCGADMVQTGTALHREGPSVFARLTRELKAVMAAKGYSTPESFRGRLQTF